MHESPARSTPSTLLAVHDLHVHFPVKSGVLQRTTGAVRAVDGVSFQLGRGETLGLVGESGCGKTTVGRAILRLILGGAATSGQVLFQARAGASEDSAEPVDVLGSAGGRLQRLRREMQIVFQDPGGSMNPRMRVVEIVGEPLIVHGLMPRDLGARARKEWLRSRVEANLVRCGMTAAAMEKYPHEFSGGQRQRIAIARALALEPQLVICDEPTSALDVSIQAQILNLLKDLQRDLGLSYLFISHDMAVIQHMCERVAVMRSGKIVEIGPKSEVIGSPRHEYTRALLKAVPVARVRRASAGV